MVLAQEFRRYAGECRQFARKAPDPESKTTWDELAERWDRCAALEESRGSPNRVHKHRRDRKGMFIFPK